MLGPLQPHLNNWFWWWRPCARWHRAQDGTDSYRITEVGTYWWATYSKHYKEKLLITTSIFNLCFLIITIGTLFRIISMQTNNIIILGDDQFLALKEDELVKTNFIVKPKEKLNLIILLLFNRCILSLNKDSIALCQKG